MDSVFLSPRVFAGQARKRTRDVYDDDDDGDVLLLDAHRFDKKPRGFEIDDCSLSNKEFPSSLPFRFTNGELKNSFDTSFFTITPPESDESASSSPANERASSTYSPISSVDVDMADSTTTTHNVATTASTALTSSKIHAMPPPARPVTRPARLNPESLNYNPSGGRLPTPIHGHFLNSQQAPQEQEIEQHPLQQANFQPPTNSMRLDRHNFSFKRPSGIKIRVPPGAYALQVPSSHMLPSPISEGDPDALAGGRLARLSVGGDDFMDVEGEEIGKSAASSGMKMNGSIQDNTTVKTSSAPLLSPVRTDLPATRNSVRRSLTVPSDKKRFCMGYRDDCEKCRMRVPGHFSHFLP